MSFITPDQMRRIEEAGERLGVSRVLLMENAGRGVAGFLTEKFGGLKGVRVLVVAGTGNNGGDGFVAARHLAGCGADVSVILLGRSGDVKTSEALLNWRILENMRRSVRLICAPDTEELLKHSSLFEEAQIIIDAIFGTGIAGKIRDPHATAIDLINRSKAFKLAVDVPSGLDPLTGEVHDKAVKADVTVTFHRMKLGLQGREGFTGRIVVAMIGVPPEAEEG